MWSSPSLPSLPGPFWSNNTGLGPIYGSNKTVWHLKGVQTNDLFWTKLLEIELLIHLTVYIDKMSLQSYKVIPKKK